MNRRKFLGSALACFALKGLPFAEEAIKSLEKGEELFPQGVASGELTSRSVLLWTRVTRPDAAVRLRLLDAKKRTVREAVLKPGPFGTVKLRLKGLKPGERYFYLFEALGTQTGGTFKTLPEEPERLKIALVTCQNYENGFYAAYEGLAAEELDLVVFLGDRIYERLFYDGVRPYRPELPSGGTVCLTEEDYAYLYKLYLSDESYKKARALQSFLYLWDDHEYANDYAFDYERGFYRLPGHPYELKREETLRLRRAAVRVWEAFTPRRLKKLPPPFYGTTYASFKLGSLGRLVVTDERSFRDLQPYYGREPKTMLGEEQKRWFFNELGQEKGWFLWANEVLFSPLKRPRRKDLDSWNGYARERDEIIKRFAGKKVLVLTGDRHAAMLWSHPWGTEVVAPPLSSFNGLDRYRRKGGPDPQITETRELKENESLKWVSHQLWGYAVVTLGRSTAEVSFYFADKHFPRSPVRLVKRFTCV
ncbi:MAG: hypothetical protein GXO03_05955 [Aquificae bacterium]|nr:hypothetical protein [Aquificota bacterium]